jgi:four helix bundle protein
MDEKKKGFRELQVWQKAKALAVTIYQSTQEGELAKDFGLRDQIRRAAVSVCSNIAEGDERQTNTEAVHFLYIAKGSLAELSCQLEIAHDIGYLNSEQHSFLQQECQDIGNMLGALIKVRRRKNRKEVRG